MAIVSLFLRTRAKIGQMELDASISETHEATAQVTKSAIENGSSIADNIVLDPQRLTMEAIVSKTPLGISALLGSAATAAAGQIQTRGIAGTAAVAGAASIGGLVTAGIASDTGGAKTRSPKDVYDYLLELLKKREPFDVLTALKLYSYMIFTSLSVPRNAGTTGGLRFTAQLEQVTIVSAESTILPLLSAGPIADAATKSADLGKQSATAASSKTADQGSLLFQGYKALGGGG